ncbi:MULTISPECIES: hypothetical protein [Chelativorans]|jgi:hypothetical protein|uniref:Conserved hypothetical membrane-anchored protein n=1 Tax=Chelativorans sp. (strain BNC1) TaxID=266779 RepID=Q11CJ3_CHESB|nr:MULTISPECIES: hypothetical protein [Chelativorans]
MQVPPVRKDGLQLEEKRNFHRLFWIVERVAWVVFALILILALAGLTGSGGYFSTATQSLSTGQVEHPRIARWEASDELRVSFEGGAEKHRLDISYSFFEYFEVEGIQPEPERMLTLPDGVAMEFAAEEGAPAKVIVYTRSLHAGRVSYRIALDGASTDASTLILP